MEKPQSNAWRPWSIWRGCGIWFPWSYGSDSTQKLRDAGYEMVNVKSYEVLGSYFDLYVVLVILVSLDKSIKSEHTFRFDRVIMKM